MEAIVFAIVLPKMMKNMIFTIPPFHMQKHAMESLEYQFVFMFLIKTPFANAIGFKPSVFVGLKDRICKALAKCPKLNARTTNEFFEAVGRRKIGSGAIEVFSSDTRDSEGVASDLMRSFFEAIMSDRDVVYQ